MLIICTPPLVRRRSASGYAHVHINGATVLRSATGMADALSAHAGEVVAVVPHSRLVLACVSSSPQPATAPGWPLCSQVCWKTGCLTTPLDLHMRGRPQHAAERRAPTAASRQWPRATGKPGFAQCTGTCSQASRLGRATPWSLKSAPRATRRS
jgi:hypothetical protein